MSQQELSCTNIYHFFTRGSKGRGRAGGQVSLKHAAALFEAAQSICWTELCTFKPQYLYMNGTVLAVC
jgi:hypothetical protein